MKRVNDLILLAATLLLTIGCAEEATTPRNHPQPQEQEEPIPEGLTAFCMDDGATRTTAEYFYKSETDRGLHYYWTEGDRLWVNTGTDLAPVLKQDDGNNIHSQLKKHPEMPTIAVKRAATAKFYFNGTFTAPSYPVRYTGKDNPDGDKVTIKAQQTQTVPNDASHIATDGDCGTAIAQKKGGRYNFTLKHKAAYATFLPYSTQAVLASNKIKIKKIRVWCPDQAISGQFSFNNSGLDLSSRPAATEANRQIELTLSDFPMSSAANQTANAATIVIAPGTYSQFNVEYTLNDPVTYQTGTVTKQYNNVTFTAGNNKRISQNLNVTVYNPQYNQWYGGNKLPNINEVYWYVEKGDPYWDKQLWIYNGHMYSGGTWIKKQSVIAAEQVPSKTIAELKQKAPNGIDYTAPSAPRPPFDDHNVPFGKPNNLNDYFYLPFLGQYNFHNGLFNSAGVNGYYWSKNYYMYPDDPYCLEIGWNSIGMGYLFAKYKHPWFSPSNEDEYRPNGM